MCNNILKLNIQNRLIEFMTLALSFYLSMSVNRSRLHVYSRAELKNKT